MGRGVAVKLQHEAADWIRRTATVVHDFIKIGVTRFCDMIDWTQIFYRRSIRSTTRSSSWKNDVRKRRNIAGNMYVWSILREFVLGTDGRRIRKETNSGNSSGDNVLLLSFFGKKVVCLISDIGNVYYLCEIFTFNV